MPAKAIADHTCLSHTGIMSKPYIMKPDWPTMLPIPGKNMPLMKKPRI